MKLNDDDMIHFSTRSPDEDRGPLRKAPVIITNVEGKVRLNQGKC